MKTKSFLYLLIACALPSFACGLSQAEIATQTAVAQTTVAASWTSTPTLTSTATFTPTPTETEMPTSTPDPCTPENLPDAVKEIQDLQARFDDLSGAAASAQRQDLPDKITELQGLLQEAENQKPPACLAALKDHQLKHMVLVIDTLKAFLDGVDQKTLDDMIKRARDEHDAYVLELSRLLGVTPTR